MEDITLAVQDLSILKPEEKTSKKMEDGEEEDHQSESTEK